MKSLFIITSAIHTSFGKYSSKIRVDQTEDTIKSIKTYAANPDIVLLDCGEKSIDNNLFDCKVVDYTTNVEIKKRLEYFLKNNTDCRPEIVIKSMLEIMMINDYLKTIEIEKYARIFKISGRYKLNNNFSYNLHTNCKNKIVILKPNISPNLYMFDNSPSIFFYNTRCWSFDISLIDEIKKVFENMKKDILYVSETKKQGDIEHLLYKHLNKKMVKNVEIMGVEGNWSPEGIRIEE